MIAVIICGYGCDPDGRKIREYMDFSALIVKNLPPDTIVITTGGHTQPKQFPGSSEAWMMKRLLKERGIIRPIIIEERSILSTQNIENSFRITKERSAEKIIIICDSIRKFKVKIFAKKRLEGSSVELDIKGFDFKRPIREKISQIFRSLLEIAGMRFPVIDRAIISSRERRIRKRDH